MKSPSNDKIEALKVVEELQLEMNETRITLAKLEKEQQAQLNAFRALRKEEEYWRLKSCNIWLQAGDKNTSFFHRKYRARLSHNHISKISSLDGQIFKCRAQIV